MTTDGEHEHEQEVWVTLARLLRPQGRKGELLAEALTDFPESLAGRADLFLVLPGVAGEVEGPGQPCAVRSAWTPHGKNAGRVVLAFAGVEDIAAAERLAGGELRTPERSRMALEGGAAYLSDLIGCRVWDREKEVGVVLDVHFPTTADGKRRLDEAAALLVVETPAGEVMIPFVAAHLLSMDREGKQLRMELPEGLIEAQLAS